MITASPASILSLLLLLTALPAAFAEDKIPVKSDPAVATAPWTNVSDEWFKRLDVYDIKPDFMRRCVGMIVAPAGDVFVLTSKDHGVCVSKDQGATWTEITGNNVTGRCETGFGFSLAYPYDGRLAFFSIDGNGGITLDGGATWRPFAKIHRMFEFADVDWSDKNSQTIFGLLHEPFYTVLSTDSGASWRELYKDAESAKDAQKSVSKYHLGIVNAGTLVRSHPDQGGIAMSADGGKTWTEVAKFSILGRRPVHYGKNVYWTAAEGVIVSSNGKDWTLTGQGPKNAVYGPYFGSREQDFMVVSDKAFSITRDGGKSWKDVAQAFILPDARTKSVNLAGKFSYFGWDSTHNLIYASSLGGSVYRRNVEP